MKASFVSKFVKARLPVVAALLTLATGASQSVQAQTVNPHFSPRGYSLPIPVLSLQSARPDLYRLYTQTLPARSVGALKLQNAPFRATTYYIGRFSGTHLFAISEHLGLDRIPLAVEFGHVDGSKFSVPVESKSLFSSVAGDFAILAAKSDLPSGIATELERLKPIKLTFTPLEALMRTNPGAKFYVMGRAAYPTAIDEINKLTNIWTPLAKDLWSKAQVEASQNLDERPDATKQVGDVFVAAPVSVMSQGLTQPLRDPDGLQIGTDQATPFLAVRPDWAPDSIAGTYRSIGRMSGGPLLMVGAKGVVVVGTHWTKGFADNTSDLRTVINISKSFPRRPFGHVVMKKGADGVLKLSLQETAPFGYSSSLARAGADLALATTDETTPITPAQRLILRSVLNQSPR